MGILCIFKPLFGVFKERLSAVTGSMHIALTPIAFTGVAFTGVALQRFPSNRITPPSTPTPDDSHHRVT